MKVSPELNVTLADPIQANEFDLPQGLIGFPDFHRAELLFDAAQLPYLWMKVSGPDGAVNFVVIEPGGIIAGYELEIFDNDAEALGIVDPGETMVLNIVTVQRQNPLHATVNLAGPIVVNRRTRVGRQLVIANYARYSTRHVLVASEATVSLSA